jgi:hypothetical protein
LPESAQRCFNPGIGRRGKLSSQLRHDSVSLNDSFASRNVVPAVPPCGFCKPARSRSLAPVTTAQALPWSPHYRDRCPNHFAKTVHTR